jgi:small subunit ribosomal protein S2
MLTNVATVNAQIKHLKQLESRMDSGDLAKRYAKLEVQRFQEEIDDLNLKYSGIKELNGRPGLVFVTDIIEDKNAVREAKKLGVPVVAIVDTNANPKDVDYVIPANDDAIKGLQLIIDYVVAAIEEGKNDKKAADVKAADIRADKAEAAKK